MSLSGTASAWTPSSNASAWAPAASTVPPLLPPTPPTPTYIALDVECVATSKSYKGRAVALIAAVNERHETIFFEYVKPNVPVSSTLEQLTGIKLEHLVNSRSLEEVMVDLRRVLGNNCILVGHGLKSDIAWLGLRAGIDFVDKKDTAKLYAIVEKPNKMTPSLRHLAIAMCGVDMQTGVHSPVADALYAMKLYQMHCNATPEQLRHATQVILNTTKPPPIAKRYPYIDGCALSSRSERYAAELELVHPSRIVFLDLDGVLNRTRTSTEIHFDDDLIQNLVELLNQAQAQAKVDGGETPGKGDGGGGGEEPRIGIVVSSFWRCFIDYITHVLVRKGLGQHIICGVTTLKGKHALTEPMGTDDREGETKQGDSAWQKTRCDEIAEYLYEHPEINRYCIVDDRETACIDGLQDHFVLTASTDGLTLKKVDEVVQALQVPRYGR